MNRIKLNKEYIKQHLNDLITLEDYVPINFKEYNAQDKRDEFLKSKGLLKTIQEMDQLLQQKIEYYEDSDKAYNSVIIEWVDVHDEFLGIIIIESITFYQTLKKNNEFIEFIDLLSQVKLPSEKKTLVQYTYRSDVIHKDDTNRMFPDFKKMRDCYDKYGASLLAAYLAYLV